MSFLCDTNVLSELVRPRPVERVVAWFGRQRRVAVSVVTFEELAYGAARAPAPRRARLFDWIEALGATCTVLDVNAGIARAAGELRAGRAAVGRPVTSSDALIAATALAHDLTVATRNVRDFAGTGARIVDPFAQ